MKKIVYFTAAALFVTACGGAGGTSGKKAALMKQCEAEGESQAMCECTVNAMADNLSPELFAKVADAAEAGNTDAMDSLSPSEQMEFMKVIPALATCASPEIEKALEGLNGEN